MFVYELTGCGFESRYSQERRYCFICKLVAPYPSVIHIPNCTNTSHILASLNHLAMAAMYINTAINVRQIKMHSLSIEGSFHFISAAVWKIDLSITHAIVGII